MSGERDFFNGGGNLKHCRYSETDNQLIVELGSTVNSLITSINEVTQTLREHGGVLLNEALKKDSIPIESHNKIMSSMNDNWKWLSMIAVAIITGAELLSLVFDVLKK